MNRDRGLVGILVLFAFIVLAAIYLMIASQLFGAFDSTPITNAPSFSSSDGMYNATGDWETAKDVGLIWVPLIIVATGLVVGTGYYLRRERFGGRRPPI